MLLARQPADWMNTSNWSRDLNIYGVVADLGNVLPAVAFGIGLTFGLSFDTAGPRREVVAEEHVVGDADAPLTADRDTPPPVAVGDTRRDADANGYVDRTAVRTTEREEE